MKQTIYFILLIVILVSGICLAQSGQNLIIPIAADTAHPSPYNLYGAKFPRIETDGRVTFRFNAPYAKKVQVPLPMFRLI